jgi:hypothetical protein
MSVAPSCVGGPGPRTMPANQLIDGFMQLWRQNQGQLRSMLRVSQDQAIYVIISGDVTRVGSIGDFDLTVDFFDADLGSSPAVVC